MRVIIGAVINPWKSPPHSTPHSHRMLSSQTTGTGAGGSRSTAGGGTLVMRPVSGVRRVCGPAVSPMAANTVTSRDGRYQLQIVAQPEQQHRARYQTEGSRGAVKDRSGNGFPIVRLSGYERPASLEIFIGTDIGRVAPHMFYQACKVSGKNSTACVEKKHEGTIVIEIELKPDADMQVTCDCVGILKVSEGVSSCFRDVPINLSNKTNNPLQQERNVDVEHRFPDQMAPRSKKKSTRCRMVFRTQLTLDDGTTETLQICSQQIICSEFFFFFGAFRIQPFNVLPTPLSAQPPGVPEICKKSLVSCPAGGGLELYILGKNFLKDTRVTFQLRRSGSPHRSTHESPTATDASPDASASAEASAALAASTGDAAAASTATDAAAAAASDAVALERRPPNEIVWEESVAPDKEYLQQVIRGRLCIATPFSNCSFILHSLIRRNPRRICAASCRRTPAWTSASRSPSSCSSRPATRRANRTRSCTRRTAFTPCSRRPRRAP